MHSLSAPDTAEGHTFLRSIGAPFIDAVFVDLYPLATTRLLENIDVGGRSLLAEAARSGRLAVTRESWTTIVEWIQLEMPEYERVQLNLAIIAEVEIANHATHAAECYRTRIRRLNGRRRMQK